MALRFLLILPLLVLAVVAKSSAGAVPVANWGIVAHATDSSRSCTSKTWLFGDRTELTRRSLGGREGRGKFISYDTLDKNRVPCDRRGPSYYNCMAQGRANPYNRGCTKITRCARDLT